MESPTPPVQSPTPNPVTVRVENHTPQPSGAGPLVGVIIIVALLIFGGLYFYGARLNAEDQSQQLPLIKAQINQPQ